MTQEIHSKQKVFVAMSGGVDSSVSAALLQQQGYDVYGVFMKNWSGDSFGIQSDCPWEQDQADAEAVCKQLGIPFRSFNFEKEYRDKVIGYFFDELRQARTPNPDVICNKEIKFGLFMTKALSLGADMIATGHYAQVRQNNGVFELYKGADAGKDQSYFLNMLTQEQLSRTLFPIGALQKKQVRKQAEKMGLKVAAKPDSQGICFIGEINVKAFLRSVLPIHKGEIRNIDTNEVIGEHDGVEFYTIGQREGLHLGGAKQAYYVVGKQQQDNVLLVAMGNDNPALFKRSLVYADLHLINPQENMIAGQLSAAIRYRQRPEPGSIDLESRTFTFTSPQRAVAPGQSLVFYKDDRCCGGAIIV